jgi:hypothetical protein
MMHETITLECEAFGYLELDVSYEEVTEDNSFSHEFGTEERIDQYAVVYAVKFNDQPITLSKEQLRELEDFITENLVTA